MLIPSFQHQAHSLGSHLRDTYLTGGGDTKIPKISTELANLKQVHVRVKIGSEGTSVFDSATALLQGLFPPTPKNREQLADGSVVVAPLGGYQYIPGMCWQPFPLPSLLTLCFTVETVEPYNDLSLESWTNCPVSKQLRSGIDRALQTKSGPTGFRKAHPIRVQLRRVQEEGQRG